MQKSRYLSRLKRIESRMSPKSIETESHTFDLTVLSEDEIELIKQHWRLKVVGGKFDRDMSERVNQIKAKSLVMKGGDVC